MKNKFDTFYDAMMLENIIDDALYGQAGSKEKFVKELDSSGKLLMGINPKDGEDAEGAMDQSENITGEINGNGRMAAECISNIYSLVEDEGQEMLDKQAAEKLGDIIELASNLRRNLNNRL